MAEQPTIRDLTQYGEITSAHLTSAVDTYWRDPKTITHALSGACVLNLTEAVRRSPEACRTWRTTRCLEVVKRAAVRTAILLARPLKG